MGVLTRYRTTTAAGVIAVFVLVLVFGSPPYGDWARDNANGTGALDLFLSVLTWPSWDFSADLPVRDVVAVMLRAILVVAFTALFLAALTAARSGSALAQLFIGWAAVVFAGAAAGLVTGIIQSDTSALAVFQLISSGATYGIFAGWIVGLATLRAPARR
ncbi:hypothetical protein SAMN04488563_7156 [Jiangella alkaliphila]|uniref:Uncharacterized protein n=1 Tax=Jiangella alkaliphila TaxID=419479 RepID=A0A1H2M7A6_9ACTN|nr:hypothetical protein SAMN04488563_7156 [Jiangella alkaliphila]